MRRSPRELVTKSGTVDEALGPLISASLVIPWKDGKIKVSRDVLEDNDGSYLSIPAG